jgi:peptidoglycan/xylan/chitin deacetylase (PgdA/CDA1 family)
VSETRSDIELIDGSVPILMYHSIATTATAGFRRFVVHPDEFRAQMDYLASAGYSPLKTIDLVAGRSSGRAPSPRPVVLTFDDAFTDFYTTALPVLRAYQFAATLYVPTAYIGGTARWLGACGEADRGMLSWQALRDIATEEVEVAAHSHTHPQLDRVPARLVRDELNRSRGLLEENLGLPVLGFAYPFGYWNRAVRAAVATAGFQYACAVDDLITRPADDLLVLPRVTVNAGLGVTGLAKVLAARSSTSRRASATLKRVAWRALRQRAGDDPRQGWTT